MNILYFLVLLFENEANSYEVTAIELEWSDGCKESGEALYFTFDTEELGCAVFDTLAIVVNFAHISGLQQNRPICEGPELR